MANIFGRQVVIPVANKSGGTLVLGDVVIVDTSNDSAVTTTTSAASTLPVGVVQETIANNATGRVLFGGYTSLVNVAASVTRGHHGTTHTVAKQATSTASRSAGTFCKFLTGGTTPAAFVYPTDLLGSSLTNPMTTAGDIIVGGASGAPARLAAGTAGYPLVGGGAGVAPAYAVAGIRHGCLVYHNATQVTSAQILANSEIYDSDGYHDTGSNTSRITIPTGLGGLYFMEYGVLVASLASGEFCRIRLNGSGYISLNEGGTDQGYISGMAVYPLAAADYVEVWFTGNRTVGHGSAYEAQFHFSATLFGT